MSVRGNPRRYAQAAFAVASEHQTVDAWLTSLGRLTPLAADEDVLAFLESPKIRPDVKLQWLDQAVPGLDPLVRNFCALLLDRGRFRQLDGILAEFRSLVNQSRGILEATVTTAVPLDDAHRARLREQLSTMTGKTVELTSEVDPMVLGGVVVRIGDRLIDGSTRNQLQTLRQALADGSTRV